MTEPSYRDIQNFREAVLKLGETQGGAVIAIGPNTAGDKGDMSAYLPTLMAAAGIPIPNLVISNYEAVTGLPWFAGSPAPYLEKQEDGVSVYKLPVPPAAQPEE